MHHAQWLQRVRGGLHADVDLETRCLKKTKAKKKTQSSRHVPPGAEVLFRKAWSIASLICVFFVWLSSLDCKNPITDAVKPGKPSTSKCSRPEPYKRKYASSAL